MGAGGYFLLPLGLSVAAWFGGEAHGKRWMTAGLIGLTLLFGLATIVTISRGAWIAAAIVVFMCGYSFKRLRMAVFCLAITGVFVAGVPPFDESISSALNRSDSSVVGHIEAIGRDTQTFLKNIIGMGLGSADRVTAMSAEPTPGPAAQVGAGTTSAGVDSEDAGIGEDLYLSVLVSTGPLGGLTFCAWCLGVILALFRVSRKAAPNWLVIGTATALVGSLVSALTSSTLMRFTTAASSWLLLGLVTGMVLATSPGIAGFAWKDLSAGRLATRLRREAPET